MSEAVANLPVKAKAEAAVVPVVKAEVSPAVIKAEAVRVAVRVRVVGVPVRLPKVQARKRIADQPLL